VAYLRPFGAIAYAHIPSNLNLSKLFPRSVKVSLLGYYGHNGYKLLERSTGTIFKSRDVIFKEGETHYAKQPTSVIFTDDTDPFSYQCYNSNSVPDKIDIPSTSTIPKETLVKTIPQEIAPRPFPITELHENREHINSSISEHKDMNSENGNQVENENQEVLPVPRRSQRIPKANNHLIESREYLNRSYAFTTDTNEWTPKTYTKAMRRPDLWWEPMVKEFEILKEREVFELVPRPLGKNVVGCKWVYAIKWNDNGEIERRKARMVVKGFTQVIGEDYDETYDSVACLESVRLLCAIAASRRLCLWQLDFVSAFLNSDSSFEVYME